MDKKNVGEDLIRISLLCAAVQLKEAVRVMTFPLQREEPHRR